MCTIFIFELTIISLILIFRIRLSCVPQKVVGPSAPAYAQNPTAILIPTVKQEGSVELP